jgi:HTH-type transcriptional regulator / antitoxin HipB
MMQNQKQLEISPIVIRSYDHLGNTIRRVRRLKGLSQADLAKKSGLTQTTISNLERAKSSAEIETLILIFAALNLDMVISPRPKPKADNQKSLEGLF